MKSTWAYRWLSVIALLVAGRGEEQRNDDQLPWPQPLRHLVPPPPPPSINVPQASYSRQLVIPFASSTKPNGVNDQHTFQQEFGNHHDEDHFALDSIISFSLAKTERDSEGAQEPQPRKVDLLQQLLRLAPEGVEKGTYDKCNHPLHSWMCRRTPSTTTTPPPVEFFPAQSFDDVQIFVPEVRTTSTTTTTLAPTTKLVPSEPKKSGWSDDADPCTHPFHSWLCAKTPRKKVQENPVPDASVVDQNLLLPPVETTTTTTSTTTSTTTFPPSTAAAKSAPRQSWDGADPCTHPFHSWLCNRNVPPPRPRTAAPTLPTVTSTIPTSTTTTTTLPPPPPPVPDASSNDEFIFFPEPSPPPPPTSPRSTPPPSTPMPKSGWDEADSCNHPFHSWLCGKTGRPRTTSSTTTSTTTTSTTTTTTPKPTIPPQDDIRLPDASNFAPKELVIPSKSGWDGADPCQHPFHSWLCNRSVKSGSGRRGRQSPYQEESDDGLLPLWEPLRISRK